MSLSPASRKSILDWNRRASLSEHYYAKECGEISEEDYYWWVWFTSFSWNDCQQEIGMHSC
jgi:hypothetical protein